MCTAHTNLFINCEYSFDRWVWNVCAGKDCHSVSNGDAIIATESGVLCPNQITIYKKV